MRNRRILPSFSRSLHARFFLVLGLGLNVSVAHAEALRVSADCRKGTSCTNEERRIRAEAVSVFGGGSAKADYRVCTGYKSCFERACSRAAPEKRSDPEFKSFKGASRPFVMPSKTVPVKGTVVLVHGLSDSPYTFGPMAESLSSSGYNVVTVLLSGHGADNQTNFQRGSITREKWLQDVAGGMELAKKLFPDTSMSLGGFSTGGALAVDYASGLSEAEQKKLGGLLLFDPALAVPGLDQMIIRRQLPGSMLAMQIFGSKEEVGSNPARIPFATESLGPALGDVITSIGKKLGGKKKLDVPAMTYFTGGGKDSGSGKTINPSSSGNKLRQLLSARQDFVSFPSLRHNALMSPSHFAHCAPSGDSTLVNPEFSAMASGAVSFLNDVQSVASPGLARRGGQQRGNRIDQ